MAKKLESTLKNMILSLFLISMVMSAALGYIYLITKGPIEMSAAKAENDAIKKVAPEFDKIDTTYKVLSPDFDLSKGKPKEIDTLVYYVLSKGGQLAGYAVKTYTKKAFSGEFKLMVGLKPDGTINQIEVLEQKETPGLGTNMKGDKFKNQFIGKDPSVWKMTVKKDGGEVDAISASTITSRAYCDAVQRGHDGYKKNFSLKPVDSDSTTKGE